MPVRHDPAVVRGGGDGVRVPLPHDPLHYRHHLLLDRLAAQDVVRRHADLAAVGELAPAESPQGVLQVGGGVDVGGGLASQLQGAGGQVLVGRLTEIKLNSSTPNILNSFTEDSPDDLPDRRAAGVEDVVELLLEQLGRLRHSPGDDLDAVGVQVARDELLQQGGRGGGDLAGLHDHGVPGGDGGEDGGEGEVEREVPGAEDQDHAVGLRVEVGSVEESDRALGTHPAVRRCEVRLCYWRTYWSWLQSRMCRQRLITSFLRKSSSLRQDSW